MTVSFKNLTLNDTYVDVEVSGMHEVSDVDEQRSFDAMCEQLGTIHRDVATAPLNERAANIWWGGESQQVRGLKYTPKHDNGVSAFDIAIEGKEALVHKQENGSGKLVRYWIDRDTNVTARIRYVNTPNNPASWRLEVYVNKRTNGSGWAGKLLATHHVHRTVTEESELTIAKYVAIYFAKFAPKPETQEAKDERLLASALKSVSTYFPRH